MQKALKFHTISHISVRWIYDVSHFHAGTDDDDDKYERIAIIVFFLEKILLYHTGPLLLLHESSPSPLIFSLENQIVIVYTSECNSSLFFVFTREDSGSCSILLMIPYQRTLSSSLFSHFKSTLDVTAC